MASAGLPVAFGLVPLSAAAGALTTQNRLQNSSQNSAGRVSRRGPQIPARPGRGLRQAVKGRFPGRLRPGECCASPACLGIMAGPPERAYCLSWSFPAGCGSLRRAGC